MSASMHPLPQEDVMAFIDGELTPERSASFSSHLETCAECSALVSTLQGVSRQMHAWRVASIPERITKGVTTASKAQSYKPVQVLSSSRARPFFPRLPGLIPALVGLSVVALLFVVATPNLLRSRMAANEAIAVGSLRSLNSAATTYSNTYGHFPQSLRNFGPSTNGSPSEESAGLIDPVLASGRKSGYLYSYYSLPAVGNGGGFYTVHADPLEPDKSGVRHFSTDQTGVIRYDGGQPLNGAEPVTLAAEEHGKQIAAISPYSVPMIAHTTDLNLFVDSLDAARPRLDRILSQHQGYVAKLSVSEEGRSQRFLVASLRVPADQLDASVAELKKLGRVIQESQAGDELSRQHTDLVARLKNSRETEQRMRAILQQRTGKVTDVLTVEQEIARVRGEIEHMEAEQKNLEHRVEFSTIELKFTEEYKSQLDTPAPAISAQLRNALVDGLRNAFGNLLAIVLFLSEAGPTILLWLAILFFPARIFWRRYRRAQALGV
jgi:hypothetical protein